jgi:hypothetical protein
MVFNRACGHRETETFPTHLLPIRLDPEIGSAFVATTPTTLTEILAFDVLDLNMILSMGLLEDLYRTGRERTIRCGCLDNQTPCHDPFHTQRLATMKEETVPIPGYILEIVDFLQVVGHLVEPTGLPQMVGLAAH